MKKKFARVLAVILSLCCLGGCGNTPVSQELNTGADQMGNSEAEVQKKSNAAILVVSFGTSYNDNRDVTIGAIEDAIADAYPEYEVRRAFTSQIIIDKLKSRDGLEIDNVKEALDRAVSDGVKELVVQPTHLMDGYEYTDLVRELSDYVNQFDKILLGEPLLISDVDFDEVVKAVTERTADYDDGETAICFMGHGTEADSNSVYEKLQDKLTAGGYENYYIGTVEADPSLDDVVKALKKKGNYKKVILEPLMVVAGDHANNDMAGEEADSWKSVLEAEGYEVECIIEGLGQIPAIQAMYVEHIKNAFSQGISFSGVSDAGVNSTVTKPADGTYSISVKSSSSMFKVVKAELTVNGDEMTAVITLSGTGYGKLYMGTAEQAAAAQDSDCIAFVEDAEGAYTYTIPVAALDVPIDCAAFSQKKEEWYDRQLTFLSSSLSGDASEQKSADGGNETALKAEDGSYTMDVTLEGGSGKTTIVSPAVITVTDGKAVATIEWNSPNYDYMLVGTEKYLPVNTEGNSVFEIPVSVFDEEMAVIGDTVAMSKPHEVEYTLTFHSDTLKTIE